MAVTRLMTIFETFEFEPEAVWSFVTTISPIANPPIAQGPAHRGTAPKAATLELIYSLRRSEWEPVRIKCNSSPSVR